MNIIEKAIEKRQNIISEYDAKKILNLFDIPVVREKLTTSQKEAIIYAEEIGYPVVLKGFSSDILHKSEYGIVELNLKNRNDVKNAYNRIITRKRDLEGVLVQKYISSDVELIVGIKYDLTFGHCIIFGLGGIFTEVLEDVSIRVVSIDRKDAEEMIKEIKGYRVLSGWRKKEKVDFKLLCDILVKVSEIPKIYPQIKELDINPLLVENGEPIAVDALIVLENKKEG